MDERTQTNTDVCNYSGVYSFGDNGPAKDQCNGSTEICHICKKHVCERHMMGIRSGEQVEPMCYFCHRRLSEELKREQSNPKNPVTARFIYESNISAVKDSARVPLRLAVYIHLADAYNEALVHFGPHSTEVSYALSLFREYFGDDFLEVTRKDG